MENLNKKFHITSNIWKPEFYSSAWPQSLLTTAVLPDICEFKTNQWDTMALGVVISPYVLSRFSHVGLCKPVNGSPAGPSVHGILQARILEWVAISSYSVSIQCSFSMGKLPSKLNCLSLPVWMRERLKEKDTIQQPSEAGYHGAKTPDTFQNNSRLSSSLELLLMAMWCS